MFREDDDDSRGGYLDYEENEGKRRNSGSGCIVPILAALLLGLLAGAMLS